MLVFTAVSRILRGSAERLEKGSCSPSIRETASSVYHIVEGTGHTEINDENFLWKKGDTCCIPAWHKYEHRADTSETVYLSRSDQKPMLKALGLYRVEGWKTKYSILSSLTICGSIFTEHPFYLPVQCELPTLHNHITQPTTVGTTYQCITIR
jgi:hypothetical protein